MSKQPTQNVEIKSRSGTVIYTAQLPEQTTGSLLAAALIAAVADGAKLSYAKLSYAKLSYVKLSYADLSYADLSGATNVDLTRAEAEAS